MILGFDDFELDTDRLELRRAGKLVKADRVVLRLLERLARSAGQLVTKDELIADVWEGRAVADTVVTVAMARLRKVLGQRRGEGEVIANVYGRGYRFTHTVVTRSGEGRRPPALVGRGHAEPPFVGREHVLERLRRASDEASSGRGRVCVLMGAPGIGKTRAVEVFESELLGTRAKVAWGFCREGGDTPPLWPFLQALREVVGSGDGGERALAAIAPELRGLIEPRAAESAGAATDGGADAGLAGAPRHRVFDALSRAFARAAEHGPWVVVLDDLHRADAASLEFLGHLIDEIAHTKLLVLATLRSEPGARSQEARHLPYVLGHRNCERIALTPLSAQDVATYVAAVLEDTDGALGRAVFSKSEGNPFYMIELARQLADAPRPDASVLAVPDAALDLLRQRVARLDQATRDLLCTAAVIGRSFDLAVLQIATGCDPSSLMASLDEAVAYELLVSAPDSATAFAFGHELLRAALYDSLAPGDQRSLHLRVADALEQQREQGDAVAPAEIAYHRYRALPDGDLRATVQACRAAAAASAVVFANADVVRYAHNALEALELTHSPSVRLRMNLLHTISLYAGSCDPDEFVRALQELLRLAAEQNDGAMLLRAAVMLNPRPGVKPQPGAHAALTRALELLAPEERAGRAVALAALACAAPTCFDRERADASLAEATQLARASGSRAARYAALLCTRYLRGGPAHEEERTAVQTELEQLARHNPDRMPVADADLAFYGALDALQAGDGTRFDGARERVAARCRELGQGELLWHTERAGALARLYRGGAREQALADLARLHAQAREQPILGTAPLCAFDRVVVLGEHGERPAIDDALRAALLYDAAEPPSLWSLKLRALAEAGLLEEARAALRVVPAPELARLPCDCDYLGTLGQLARAALSLSARDYAEALLPLLSRFPDRFAIHVAFRCDGAVSQLLGMLEHALGRRAQAIAHLSAAIEDNARARLPGLAAESRLELARCLREGGNAEERRRAAALTDEARAQAAALGLESLARRAAEL